MTAKAIVEAPVFDMPHNTRQHAIDCERSVGDLMRARTDPALWAVLSVEEPRLLSALAGLQFICSLLQDERQKKARGQ
jgi:hypothetical protein